MWVSIPTNMLAQSAGGAGVIFFWAMVLIGLLLWAGAGVVYFRRWYGDTDLSSPVGFTLGDLRQLHRDGQMTDEEFESAKMQLLGQTHRTLDEVPDPAGANPGAMRDVKPDKEE